MIDASKVSPGDQIVVEHVVTRVDGDIVYVKHTEPLSFWQGDIIAVTPRPIQFGDKVTLNEPGINPAHVWEVVSGRMECSAEAGHRPPFLALWSDTLGPKWARLDKLTSVRP